MHHSEVIARAIRLGQKAGETPAQALERVQWQQDDTEVSENRRILAALLRSDVEVRGDF